MLLIIAPRADFANAVLTVISIRGGKTAVKSYQEINDLWDNILPNFAFLLPA